MQFDPTLYVITDSTYHTDETLLRAVDQACAGGATLIQLREKDTRRPRLSGAGPARQGGHRPVQRAAHHRRPRGRRPRVRRRGRACRRERPAGRGVPPPARPGQDRRRDGQIGRGRQGRLRGRRGLPRHGRDLPDHHPCHHQADAGLPRWTRSAARCPSRSSPSAA